MRAAAFLRGAALPGIQVEFSAIRNAGKVARSLGWSDDDKVIAGLVRLWEQCCDADDDQVAAPQLRGLFGVDQATLDLLVPALVAFNFLAPRADGWRIRGAEDRIFRFKRARRAGGLASKKNLIPGARHRKDPAAQAAETPAASELEPKNISAGAGLALGSLVGGEGVVGGAAGDPGVEGAIPPVRASRARAASRPALELVPVQPPDLPDREWVELIEALVTTFAAKRGGAKYDPTGQDFKALKALRARQEPAAIRDAWGRALDHTGFPTVATLAELTKNFNHFSGKKAPAGGTRHQRAEAQNHDGDEPF